MKYVSEDVGSLSPIPRVFPIAFSGSLKEVGIGRGNGKLSLVQPFLTSSGPKS